MNIETQDYEGTLSENSESDDGSIVEYLETETPEGVKRKHEENISIPSKRSKGAFQPPTAQELNQFRETENLFSSNLFRIQIEEMIKETQIKVKYQNLFNVWFNNFKTYVCTPEKPKEIKFSDMSWSTDLKVSLPLNLSTRGSIGHFTFSCPKDITVGGSYSILACIGPVYSVDIYVHMPVDCFTMKDVRDMIFDHKRAFYLALLTDKIIKSDLVEDVQYLHGNGCPMKPILELKPTGRLGKQVRVFLWPVTSIDIVKLTRLHPGWGNIREVKTGSVVLPSPHYNSGVAQDIVWRMNQDLLESEMTASSTREGLILLKVWLRQRRLDQGYGSFGGFIMSMYLVYLLQNKRLNKLMSSYQVVRIAWHSLANSDWTSKGISLSSSANAPDISDFHKYFDVVFVDVSGVCNLCAHLKKEIYLKVKEESTRALSCLDSSSSNSFQVLFMTPVDFEQSNDYLIRFHDEHSLVRTVENYSDYKENLLQGGWILPALLKIIMSPLQQGLGQRAVISFCPPKIKRWKCTDPPPDISLIHDNILLGLRLSSSYAFEKLERGPAADNDQAQVFRDFWGDLSQLRRFKDGSICEAIVWNDDEPICKQIVEHILKRHVGLDKNSYVYVAHLPDGLLTFNNPLLENCPQGEPAFREALISFEDVTKALRSLSKVTLSVNSVQGISPLFYFADVFPSYKSIKSSEHWLQQSTKIHHSSLTINDTHLFASHNENKTAKPLLPPFCTPIEAVLTLEHSGKWPQNLAAVRRLKAAFCIQLTKALKQERNIIARPQVDHIDILKDGFVFRIWLLALKEIELVKQKTNELGLIDYHDTPESLFLEEKFVLLPKLSSSLNGLQKKFLGFSPTVRIAKRWLSSQFLGPPYIPDIVTELLVSYLFISPEPFHPPTEPQLGLLQFLRLLSCTDWLTTPIIVNLNSEFTQEKIVEIETKFNSTRKTLPPLFISTPYDSKISQFTRKSPTVPILIRLSLLASEALKQLQTQCYFSEVPLCKPIFRPNRDEYDVIITLKLASTTRWMERVDKVNWKFSQEDHLGNVVQSSIVPVVGFDPVQSYLAELREGYDHCALFFHDVYGGNVIGVLWKPCSLEEKKFKVSVLGGHKPAQNSNIILNKDAILEDFLVIGKGLVQTIVQQTKRDEI